APEVIQSSAMDCGPASLKCLLEGYGIPLSYGRLREACQTGVDGTSIDTLEEIAVKLGLPAEQVMVPVDHVLLPEAKLLPALIVVRLPNGNTHFVVLWRRVGPFVQIMDPGTGRKWVRVKQFEKEIYQHQMAVPAAAWQEYASSEDFLNVLKAQMGRLGLPTQTIEQKVGQATKAGTWQAIAQLDGAVRLTAAVAGSTGRIGRSQTAKTLLDHFTQPLEAGEDKKIPLAYWPVQPLESDDQDEDENVILRGAVLIKISRDEPFNLPTGDMAGLEPELQAALTEDPVRPLRELWQLARLDGWLPIMILTLALALSAVGLLAEIILLRGLLEIGLTPLIPRQQAFAVLAIGLFLALAGDLHMWVEREMWRFGRRSEVRLR
ncbi:MAG: cysteine peptidase family C39 domain-containing protein, partial [Pseudomonadota bacterium]